MNITVAMPVHNAALSAVTAAYQILDNIFCCEAAWQLLVIDDHSNAEERAILEHLGRMPGVRLAHTQDFIDTPNPNLGWNVNWAMDQVTPEDDYFLHVESDVYLEPFCLRELVRGIGDAAMATPHYFSVCKRLATHSYPDCIPNVPIELIPKDAPVQTIKWGHLGCMLIRGDVARDRAIRIDADTFRLWYADFDLCGSIVSKGHHIVYVPSAHVRHRGNVSSHAAPGGGAAWPGVLTQDEARVCVQDKWGFD